MRKNVILLTVWEMPQLDQRYRNAIVFWGGDPPYKAELCTVWDWTRRKSEGSKTGVQPDSEHAVSHPTHTQQQQQQQRAHSSTVEEEVALILALNCLIRVFWHMQVGAKI